jgi:hypothetical protein
MKTKASLVPLQLATLCLDCEMITPAQGTCLACGSGALLNLARALNEPGAKRNPHAREPALAQIVSRHPVRYGDFLHST